MKLSHVIGFCIVAVGMFAGCDRNDSVARPEGQSAARLDWLTDFEAAQARARAENKTLLIDFTGSDWCPPCIKLRKQVFSQPEFAEYAAKNLILLEVDFPRGKAQSAEQKSGNQKLAQQFQIEGFPTIVVMNPAGKILGQMGYVPGGAKAFIAELDRLRGPASAPASG